MTHYQEPKKCVMIDCKDNILIALDIFKEKNKSENTCTNLDTCVSSVIKNLSWVKIDYQQLGAEMSLSGVLGCFSTPGI